mgnify:FL=1
MVGMSTMQRDWIRLTELVDDNPTITSPREAAEIVRHLIEKTCGYAFEHMVAVFLNNLNHIVGHALIGIGGFASAQMIPPLLFKQFFETPGATALILAHNHPSGTTEPSEPDMVFANYLSGLCNALQIQIVDQLVVTAGSYSRIPFKEKAVLILEKK